jgi:hypothetical protein
MMCTTALLRRSTMAILLLALTPVRAQGPVVDPSPEGPPADAEHWYQRLSIRGYAQARYNGLLVTNDSLSCDQCDRSWGGDGGFFLRRLRIALSGYVHPRVFVYVQPDLVSWVGGSGYVTQLRDCYMDLGLDPRNELRLRLGQSKVPFGYENLQSSSQRVPLDRADAVNSAHKDERDVGAFLFWSPTSIRELAKQFVDDGLKGSGDFGALALGVYNGQGTNQLDRNQGVHVVARAAWPFQIGSRYVEAAVAGYTGEYVLGSSQLSPGIKTSTDLSYEDTRAVASLSLFPAPFGILAEYNLGRGPEFDPATDSIATRDMSGGYITAMYRMRFGGQELMPFVRYQRYAGGKKFEQDARSYDVEDLEFGVEWRPNDNFELTCEYYIADRSYIDLELPVNHQQGSLLRLQAQVNF